MNENKLIAKSERSNYITVIIILGIALLSGFIYLISIKFQPKIIYELRTKTFLISVLILLILYCIFYLLNIKRVYVYRQYFEIKNLFGTKRYFFTDFKTHYSEEKEDKYNSWTEYYLITNDNKKITLVDTEYSNFHFFFRDISKNIKVNKKLNDELTKPKFLKYAIICSIISLTLFYFSSHFYNFKPLSENDLVYVTDVLQENIKLKKGSKGSKSMEIFLKKYPIFTFRKSGYNEYLINNFGKGDTIQIGILKEEFEKKISKTKSLTFMDKYLNFTNINIKQFKTKEGNDFYNLASANDKIKENNIVALCVLSFFGLLFLVMTIGNYNAYLKSKKNP